MIQKHTAAAKRQLLVYIILYALNDQRGAFMKIKKMPFGMKLSLLSSLQKQLAVIQKHTEAAKRQLLVNIIFLNFPCCS